MTTLLRPALTLFVLLTLVTGVAYPLLVTSCAQLIYPTQANGSLIFREGQPVGSRLIGQQFSQSAYFWGRPSATSPVPYNAAASSGSNLGPLNPALVAAVSGRISALHAADPGNSRPIPIDLITASASGLDPHISVAAADYQADRVARARQLDVQVVRRLIAAASAGRDFGIFGEARVNVLALNLALDGLTTAQVR